MNSKTSRRRFPILLILLDPAYFTMSCILNIFGGNTPARFLSAPPFHHFSSGVDIMHKSFQISKTPLVGSGVLLMGEVKSGGGERRKASWVLTDLWLLFFQEVFYASEHDSNSGKREFLFRIGIRFEIFFGKIVYCQEQVHVLLLVLPAFFKLHHIVGVADERDSCHLGTVDKSYLLRAEAFKHGKPIAYFDQVHVIIFVDDDLNRNPSFRLFFRCQIQHINHQVFFSYPYPAAVCLVDYIQSHELFLIQCNHILFHVPVYYKRVKFSLDSY